MQSLSLHHVALYVQDLEKMRVFYETYLGAQSNTRYHNPRTGLQTYFLTFAGGGQLELMTRPALTPREDVAYPAGYAHVAYCPGNRAAVDALTAQLKQDGYTVLSGPRVTGDGYYESCVLDPERNTLELVAG